MTMHVLHSIIMVGIAESASSWTYRLRRTRDVDGSGRSDFLAPISLVMVVLRRLGARLTAVRNGVLGSSEARLHLAG